MSKRSLALGIAAVVMAALAYSQSTTWTASGLPPGMTLEAKSGVISGTAKKSGTYTFKACVTDGSTPPATTCRDFNLLVRPLVTIEEVTLSPLDVGSTFSLQLKATITTEIP